MPLDSRRTRVLRIALSAGRTQSQRSPDRSNLRPPRVPYRPNRKRSPPRPTRPIRSLSVRAAANVPVELHRRRISPAVPHDERPTSRGSFARPWQPVQQTPRFVYCRWWRSRSCGILHAVARDEPPLGQHGSDARYLRNRTHSCHRPTVPLASPSCGQRARSIDWMERGRGHRESAESSAHVVPIAPLGTARPMPVRSRQRHRHRFPSAPL